MDAIQLFCAYLRIEETLEEIRICLEKGWTGLGFKTIEFEEAWKAYTGLPHAIFSTRPRSTASGIAPAEEKV